MKVLVKISSEALNVEIAKCNNSSCTCVNCNCGSNCTCVSCN